MKTFEIPLQAGGAIKVAGNAGSVVLAVEWNQVDGSVALMTKDEVEVLMLIMADILCYRNASDANFREVFGSMIEEGKIKIKEECV